MKRIMLAVFALVMLLSGLVVACASPGGDGGTTAPQTDGNYTVRIGFPSFTRDTRAPDGPDIWALDQGYVSVTPLHIYQGNGGSLVEDGFCSDALCSDLARELPGFAGGNHG